MAELNEAAADLAPEVPQASKLEPGSAEKNIQIHCRMYEQQFPNVDDLVMVKVTKIDAICAFVNLLEYNNREAIILLSELSRRRMKSVHKHIRIGNQEVLQVLRVDKEKGYVDLSKKNLTTEDIADCTATFNKAKTVHSIMKHVAERCHIDTIKLYEEFGWTLYRKYGHAYEAFKEAVNTETVFDEFNLNPIIKDELIKIIQHRFAVQPVKYQADLEVTCFTREGINAIIPALKAGKEFGTPEEPVKINLLSTPLYIVSVSCLSKDRATEILNNAIKAIEEKITVSGGNLVVKEQPRVVS